MSDEALRIVKAAEQPEAIDIKMADGLFVKSFRFKRAGSIVPQHAHSYDHLSHISSGAVRAFAGDALIGVYVGGDTIVIKALVKHRFETLMDNTVILCIHNADRAENGEPAVHDEHHLTFSESV